MKTGKHITAVIFTVLVIFLLPVQVLAAGKVDPDREISLTIRNRYGEEGISGVTFDLFLVSTMDQNGELQPTEDFEGYAEELDIRGENDELWIQMAYTLEEDILSGILGEMEPADSLVTGQDGSVSFPSGNQALVPGLYLVLGTHIEKDNYVYSTSPFFVCLPNRDAETDQWDYTVEANAKPDRKPVIGDLSVVKVWEDDCHKSQRPASISVQLVCDGQNYGDPVTLPYNGQWKYTWENLEMNHSWTVTETPVAGYKKAEVRQEGNTFIMKNVCDRPPGPGGNYLPKTGQLWWPVCALSAAGLLLILIGLIRRRRNADYEK